ncbi:MAG: trypsin-like peptidase domain-containing protein [Chloroflexota bacterium]|nr:trypsin-like peptidase domain-containing protein [Chloroflexota bacterium]
MKSRKFRLWLIVGVLLLAMMACSIPSLPFLTSSAEQTPVIIEEDVEVRPETETTQRTEVLIPNKVLMEDALVKLYDQVSPGVVSIQVYSQFGEGLGSGFVIDKEGHIVTNYHVVDGAEEVEVHFQSGLKVYGDVIGEDLDSDLAVIQIDVNPAELHPLTLGDSDRVLVGQSVIAIGNPYGLSGTMTTGIVSARGRTLESIRQTESGSYFSTGDLIQTDATINPGNSGGPLLNLNGEVIGVNRAIQTSGSTLEGGAANTGIGFAVSSNILKLVLPALKQGETYSYPYLGLSALSSLTLTQAEYLGIPQATGAYVAEIVPGGPADQAGIRAGNEPTQVLGLYAGGDLIIGVDGREMQQFSDMLSYMILNKKPGDEITLTVLRVGQEMDITVVLGERPESIR